MLPYKVIWTEAAVRDGVIVEVVFDGRRDAASLLTDRLLRR